MPNTQTLMVCKQTKKLLIKLSKKGEEEEEIQTLPVAF